MPAHLIDVTNVAAAGGTVRFYQPGTLIQANVFNNDAATFILTQPISLDTNGKTASPVYSTTPVRAIYFSSTGAQLQDTERSNGERAEITSLVNTRWPLEATVDQALTALAISLGGDDGNSQASFTGATSRTVRARLEDQVDVKDFGAKGDGVTFEDTAFSAAITFVGNTGRTGVLRVPAGTYLFANAVVSGGTALNEITFQGDGKGSTVLKANGFTSGNFFTSQSSSFPVNYKDLSITNSSSSTGAAINNAGNRLCLFSGLDISGFRTGVNALAGKAFLVDVATDNNAAGSAFTAGADAMFLACSCNTNSAASAGIRIPSGGGAAAINIIGCILPNTTSRGVLFEAGHATLGATIVGNRFDVQAGTGGITTSGDTTGASKMRIFCNSGVYAVVENAASTDITNTPSAGVCTLDLAKSRYFKVTLAAATSITYTNPATGAGPFHDEQFTVVLQNGTGGGFAITSGTGVVLQTGGFTVAATSQSVIQMQYDSNANKLIQTTSPVAMTVT